MKRVFKFATATLLVASTLMIANAANVNISKLRITLNKEITSESLNVINENTKEPNSVQIELKKWTQKQNPDNTVEDIFEDTENIIVSPKTTVIPVSSSKSIRLLVDDEESSAKDYSYRLFIQELPKPKIENNGNSINMLFRFSIPVFNYSEEIKTVDKMNISAHVMDENGKKYILIENNDTQHIQIKNVLDKEQSNIIENNKLAQFENNIPNGYLLPGMKNKYIIHNTSQDFSTFTIITDKGNKKFTK